MPLVFEHIAVHKEVQHQLLWDKLRLIRGKLVQNVLMCSEEKTGDIYYYYSFRISKNRNDCVENLGHTPPLLPSAAKTRFNRGKLLPKPCRRRQQLSSFKSGFGNN